MPIYFFDSSALVKRYRSEAGSDVVERLLIEPTARCYISRLAVVEVQRAFSRRVREREITEQELDSLRDRLYGDLGQRLVLVRKLRDFHYHNAVRLVRKYAPPQQIPLLRSLDAIHLVSALDLHARQPIDFFVSADRDLCKVAEAEQLNALNPETA
ncbi:MAG TPA: type II toxin-antitoxin system VapC family toxin [Methylomirabilota bacterium]|jgi:predicted nucleic acid-binding protein|nr:type II toxin-antitoxin system VapC family toxin [Methylomirabilota bacterium]